MQAPQARNVNNRRWSEAEPAAGHNIKPLSALTAVRQASPARAESQILFSPCRAGRLRIPNPPVPRSLRSRSTDGYSHYAPAALAYYLNPKLPHRWFTGARAEARL